MTGWRLPSTTDTGAPGCDYSLAGGTDCRFNVDTASSEMAHMYYVTLGNLAPCVPGTETAQPGWGLTNTARFVNAQSTLGHWSITEYAPNPDRTWNFRTYDGFQYTYDKDNPLHAVAVYPGDVAAVLEPQTWTLLLLGSGAVMVAVKRRPR